MDKEKCFRIIGTSYAEDEDLIDTEVLAESPQDTIDVVVEMINEIQESSGVTYRLSECKEVTVSDGNNVWE